MTQEKGNSSFGPDDMPESRRANMAGICLSVKRVLLLSPQEKKLILVGSIKRASYRMMTDSILDYLGENSSCFESHSMSSEAFDGDVFTATLIPTEGCNFRCLHCRKSHPAASMTRDMLDRIEAFIAEQAPRHKKVMLAWGGGEPLLCKDTVLEVSDMVQNLQKQYGFQYAAKMTTNGYLLDEKVFHQIYRAGIRSVYKELHADRETGC